MAEDTPGARVGRRVRALRQERLLSQPELAESSGLSILTIRNIEGGAVAHPRRKTLGKLAGPLGVSVEEIIGMPRPLTPALSLAAMTREPDAGARHRALEAATDEEFARYLRDIDRAVTAAGQQLRSPEHQEPGEQAGLEGYMQALLDLREEAEPYVGTLPPAAQEMAHHASVPAAGAA